MNKKFEDILNSGEILYYRNKGDSMYPLIEENKCILKIIPKPNSRLKVGDIPLYKRDNGKYVLHRIIKVKSYEYYLRGDNRVFTERGIEDRHIIGVLDSIIKDGKEIKVYGNTSKLFLLKLKIKFVFEYIAFRFNNLLKKLR